MNEQLITHGVMRDKVQEAVTWLNGQRSAFGGYGSTQSTILALKALTEHAKASAAPGPATLSSTHPPRASRQSATISRSARIMPPPRDRRR